MLKLEIQHSNNMENIIKSIKLTQIQKQKLLEMCKFLFPEYNDFEITSSFPYYNSNKLEGVSWKETPTEDAVCLIKDDKDDYRSVTVHWFEFCIKHLIPKLAIDMQYAIDLRILFCELPNPIDYLYEHFKKLK